MSIATVGFMNQLARAARAREKRREMKVLMLIFLNTKFTNLKMGTLKTIIILLGIAAITLQAYSQEMYMVKKMVNHHGLLDSLKSKVDQDWIKPNPSFKGSQPSFFNHDNEHNYYIGLMQISGQEIPFINDDDLSLLQFLLRNDSDILVLIATEADQQTGTLIFWNKMQAGMLWFNDKSYLSIINNWNLAETMECPGTIIFPALYFRDEVKIPNAKFNDISGLAIFPYDTNISIVNKQLVLKTLDGVSIQGSGYDLNQDKISDVFIYDEDIDESSSYTRLFLNVDGKWKCTWVSFNQECI
jgi:hypothetical protein